MRIRLETVEPTCLKQAHIRGSLTNQIGLSAMEYQVEDVVACQHNNILHGQSGVTEDAVLCDVRLANGVHGHRCHPYLPNYTRT